jgi:hypothetical protein
VIPVAARYTKNLIPVGDRRVAVYASPKISAAFSAVVEDMTLYKGVKLAQVLEAVYEQGRKDGARDAFENAARALRVAERLVPHRNPGKPRHKA